MFADPITITVNGVAKAMTRVNQDAYSSEYLLRESLGEYTLKVRHSSLNDKLRPGVKIDRHNVEFVQTLYPVAPSTTSRVRKAYMTFENERADAGTEPQKHTLGLASFMTEPNIVKLLNLES